MPDEPKVRKPRAVKIKTEQPKPVRRLLDEKIVPEEKIPKRLSRVILAALILGILAGTGAIIYLNKHKADQKSDLPEITVPTPESASAPTTTPEITPAPAAANAVQMVEITRTPTGTLNVRTGPGTGYKKIGEVKPGETFELVRESAGWYEIKLAGGTGYVIKTYAKLK